jgi:hypothetical protein
MTIILRNPNRNQSQIMKCRFSNAINESRNANRFDPTICKRRTLKSSKLRTTLKFDAPDGVTQFERGLANNFDVSVDPQICMLTEILNQKSTIHTQREILGDAKMRIRRRNPNRATLRQIEGESINAIDQRWKSN